MCLKHLGEFPIGSYLKVKDSTKSSVTFLVLVRGIFLLYHLKAYLYSFILSRGFKFLGAPFMAYNGLKSKKWLKIDSKSIFNHEGGTQKIKATAQNKAIYISFQMIKKKISSDKYKKSDRAFSGVFDFKVRPYGKFA